MQKKLCLALCAALFCLWDLSKSAPEQFFAEDKVAQIDGLMQLNYDYGYFNGAVLIAEGGKVIYKKGFGLANMEWNIPNRPDTKFRLGSVTKQFTSMLILQMVEEGKISLEGKLFDYLPYYRQDTGKKVAIHHLLTHTSGIPNYTSLPNFDSEANQNPFGVEEFIKRYCSGDLGFVPGSRYDYSNSGYFLLGAVIEKVTGKSYEKVLEQKIFQPLGMKNSGYDHHQRILVGRAAGYTQSMAGFRNAPYLDMSVPYAAGALYSTVEDLYLWDQALYTDKLLSAKMREIMFTPHVRAMGDAYGYGWSVGMRMLPRSNREIHFVYHGGGINGFSARIERIDGERHLIVLLNNTGGTNLGEMSVAITRILFHEPYELPKKSIARTIYKTVREKGLEAGVDQYHELKKGKPTEYDFSFAELDRLGYALLEAEKTDDAIKVFQLNIEAFPQDATGYDSLGEAYATKGETVLAIKSYAKSLEIDPENVNAVERLKKLREK